ncbi:MAG: hypothetical protein ACE5GW_14390 [Planctomycetota bacterium]
MRFGALLMLLALSVATGLSLRPLWFRGPATVDPPLLLLLWLALTDRRLRIYVAAGILAALRAHLGLSSLLAALLPLAAAIEAVLLMRRWVHLRDPWRRLPVTGLAASAAILLHHLLLDAPPGTLAIDLLLGALLSTLSAAILFPILDLVRPLIRSARFSM